MAPRAEASASALLGAILWLAGWRGLLAGSPRFGVRSVRRPGVLQRARGRHLVWLGPTRQTAGDLLGTGADVLVAIAHTRKAARLPRQRQLLAQPRQRRLPQPGDLFPGRGAGGI